MKKLLLVALFGSLLISCSNDLDDVSLESNSFFNINQGNKWVYKKYESSGFGPATYSNIIDSVEVIGDEFIVGLNYKKIRHRVYWFSNLQSETFEYLRINSNDHLVDSEGTVKHPGFDAEFSYSFIHNYPGTSTPMGKTIYQLQSSQNEIVEGNSFIISNYQGNFTSYDSMIPNNHIDYKYSEGIGMISNHCPSVSGSYYYEFRLVYYEIN